MSSSQPRSDRAYANCLNGNLHEAVSAWFLGPQAENLDMLKGLFAETANLQASSRLAYFPEDGPFITDEIRESAAFQEHRDKLVDVYTSMTQVLFDYSVPFFSQRYAGHMCFEQSLPGILGWTSTVLCNPNNVTFEASPVTTILELEVGLQMCEMLGYNDRDDNQRPMYWGHIACDGTVANLESIWVARNLKYYPLSLRDAMKPGNELEGLSDSFSISLPTDPDTPVLFSKLTTWQLLNLPSKTILGIPDRLYSEFGITATYLDSVLDKYIVQSRGKQAVESEWGIKHAPQYLISATRHYSWPKGAAIAGLGSDYMVEVPVDYNARVNIDKLREALDDALQNEKPVFAVVGIIGSTEEGSVDPLDKIIDLRDEYEKKGLCFLVHADAAWGGYFASMIRHKGPSKKVPGTDPDRRFVPSQMLRKETARQLRALARADTITIDPHKAGYIPYPAGGLCYKDGRLRYLVTWNAPYIHQSAEIGSIGTYGVEGSKPGAPAVAAYLHHEIIGLHDEGHGALLGEATWSCRRIAAHWSAMSVKTDPFIVVPMNGLTSEPELDTPAVEELKLFIRENILGHSNEDIVEKEDALKVLCALGSDLNINAFACNFRINGVPNTDVEEANFLNASIFKRLSITTPGVKPRDIEMFLSSTTFTVDQYEECATHFKKRMGLETESRQDLLVLRNVVMSPFQTAGDFVQDLANIFQRILNEEIENVVWRNTIEPQCHSFVVQYLGTGEVFLIYRPYFHKANCRFQIVLYAILRSTADLGKLNGTAILDTTKAECIDDICRYGASFSALITDGNGTIDVEVHGVRVIKKCPLDSRLRDAQYPPTFVPFYLYGKDASYFIDHMLLRAPNAQMCASVELELDNPLPSADLHKGLLLSVARSEAAMQPADGKSTEWFKAGAKLNVSIYADPNAALAQGPGLASVIGKEVPLATGTATLGATFVDCTRVNQQLVKPRTAQPRTAESESEPRTADSEPRIVNFASVTAHAETKKDWHDTVKSYFK